MGSLFLTSMLPPAILRLPFVVTEGTGLVGCEIENEGPEFFLECPDALESEGAV